uniref:Uncharacterized protein n=1 Tax=uncultured marine virus TaxID=186617 RepID=A0A0F7L4S9_9VIRU|nr:hypothetical protein [uncultured marine virus]
MTSIAGRSSCPWSPPLGRAAELGLLLDLAHLMFLVPVLAFRAVRCNAVERAEALFPVIVGL